MNYDDIKEVLVYSQKPSESMIDFCISQNIEVVWLEEGTFRIWDRASDSETDFDPLNWV